jgi:hypothetical protein
MERKMELDRRQLISAAGLVLFTDLAKLLGKEDFVIDAGLHEEYAALLHRKDQVVQAWANTHLLDGIEDANASREVAVAIDNQRLFNEDGDHMPTLIKRLSIPVVRRAYASPLLHTIAPMNVSFGPTCPTYWMKDNKIVKGVGSGMGTVRLRCVLETPPQQVEAAPGFGNLDAEVELNAAIAKEVADELIEATVNACKLVAWHDLKGLPAEILLKQAACRLRRYHPTGMNWVVASEEFMLDLYAHCQPQSMQIDLPAGLDVDGFIKRLKQQFAKANPQSFSRYYGLRDRVDDTTLWVDRVAVGKWAVAGAYPGSVCTDKPLATRRLMAGLQFCPYVPISAYRMKSPEGGDRYNFYSRYGWAVHPDGGKFFVTMNAS